MAKVSSIIRNKKRLRLVKRFRSMRQALKRIIKKDVHSRDQAIKKLLRRRRDESPSRFRQRCRVCGRPNGTVKKFGLCRIHLRLAVMRGDVPGLRKASW